MNSYKLLGIGHYVFWAEIFTEFSRHLDQNYKKRTKRFGLKEKIRKITQVGWKISVQEKKKWKGSVLVVLAQNLFYNWKFQLKISVKTSAKARGLLSLFFSVFLLYSRAILSFSLSPSLLLRPFHCFNCWIILENLSC